MKTFVAWANLIQIKECWREYIRTNDDKFFVHAVLLGLFELPECDDILKELEIILSTEEVGDTLDRYEHTLYGILEHLLPANWREGRFGDEEKVPFLEMVRELRKYWGYGIFGRMSDHEGYALAHWKAEKEGKDHPQEDYPVARWMETQFGLGRTITKFLIFESHHAKLCKATESSLIAKLPNAFNRLRGRRLASIFGPFAHGEEEFLMKFLVSVAMSRFLFRGAQAEDVSLATARINPFPRIYFGKMVHYLRVLPYECHFVFNIFIYLQGFSDDSDIKWRMQNPYRPEESTYSSMNTEIKYAMEDSFRSTQMVSYCSNW